MKIGEKLIHRILNKIHPAPLTDEAMIHLGNHARVMFRSAVALADSPENLDELHIFTHAFFMITLGDDVTRRMEPSLYSLDEYVKLMLDKRNGEEVDEQYLRQLRKDLLGKSD